MANVNHHKLRASGHEVLYAVKDKIPALFIGNK